MFAALAFGSVNFFLAIPLAIAGGALVGAACERLLLRPLRAASIDTTMLVMIGLWIALQNAELLVWGGVAQSVPTPFPTAPVVWGPVSVSPLRIFVFAASICLIAGAHVLLTISFAGVVSFVSVNWMDLTNGPLGIPGVPARAVALPGLPELSLRSKSAFYYLVLVAVVAAYVLCRRLIASRIGRALIALRENETLAESVGIDGTHCVSGTAHAAA